MFSRSSVLFLLLRSVISIDSFAANLDCLRINVAFCCTSRIKSACPGLCSNIDCSPSFYRGMFSTDEDIQEGTVSVDSSIQRKEAPTIVATSTSSRFPTLVPETKIVPVTETTGIPITEVMETTETPKTTTTTEKETAEIATTTGIWHLGEFGTEASTATIPIETTSLMTDLPITMESRATRVPRIRVTPDPRIIPPPDELAFISDIDENGLNEDGTEIQPATSDFLHHHRSQLPEIVAKEMIDGSVQEVIPPSTSSPSSTPSTTSSSPLFFTFPTFPPIFSLPTFPPFTTPTPISWMTQFSSSIEFPSVPAASPANDRIFASTISNKQPTPLSGQLPKDSSTNDDDNSKAKSFSYALEPLVEKLLSSLPAPLTTNGQLDRKQKKSSQKSARPQIQLKYKNLEGMVGSLETSTKIPIRTTIPPEGSFSFKFVRRPSNNNSVVEKICGVGPEYSPCIPLDVASARLLVCLQSKNLPIGCQKLARYDVTQKEVRDALDRGACGLLHIAPFLECASQKGDNVECCKTKGVHTKGGQQCLSFCSSGPISPGIQHLSCSSAMQEMLQCHHAGLKP